MKLIVATLLIAASLSASDNGENKLKIKAFQELSPEAILDTFNLRFQENQLNQFGTRFWTVKESDKTDEYLLSGLVPLYNRNYKIRNKKIGWIELSFYKPRQKTHLHWRCWKANYIFIEE